ncbi:transposase [Nitrosococcus watsonii]|uniref:transposase n=1 Tax=Nitrosococcus watsonii TaxID=473531 RepID=UPI0009FF19F2
MLRSGFQWGILPKYFPPWQTVYGYFPFWHKDGTWARIHNALYCQCSDLEGREESSTLAIIDAQSIKTGLDVHGNTDFDTGTGILIFETDA